jgi:hypothetical protein
MTVALDKTYAQTDFNIVSYKHILTRKLISWMFQIQGGFLADFLYISPYVSTCPSRFILVGLIYLTLLGNEYSDTSANEDNSFRNHIR